MLLTNLPATVVPLRLARRRSFVLGVKFVDADDVAVPLDDCTVSFVMAPQIGTGLVDVDLILLDEAGGVSQLVLDAADTDLSPGTYDATITLLTPEGYSAAVVTFEVEVVDNPDPATTGTYTGGGFTTAIAIKIGERQELVVKQATLPPVGTPGKSNYELAQEYGFVGTEADYLDSLIGTDGDDGADGAPGADGADGAPGAPGADASRGPVAFNTQTGSYTLVLADAMKFIQMNSASALNLTVPPNSAVAFPVGTVVSASQAGAGQVTLVQGSGVTLRSAAGLKTLNQYAVVEILKIATDEWLVYGRTTT